MKRSILALILVSGILFMTPWNFVSAAMLAPGHKTFHGTLTTIKDTKTHYEIKIDAQTFNILKENKSRSIINQARLLIAQKVSISYKTDTKEVLFMWPSRKRTRK